MAENTDAKLLQDYEDIRRREVNLITELLDVLPRIDNLDEGRVGQVRDAMFHADHPYMMVFVGAFNSGKSSLINALLGANKLLKVGSTPTTDRIFILRYGDEAQQAGSVGSVDTVFYPSPLLKKVSFVDTPGLESVFRDHEETTRKFLHRADVVLLTMLATQAMTKSNMETLRTFREYGKKVIVVVNQVDLLTDAERDTVRDYVLEQSKDVLGFSPEVWMVSGKWGQQAHAENPPNAEWWQKSGLGIFETYITQQLSDVARLRQKLQTPLQIIQNAHASAIEVIKHNQATFDQYQGIVDNIDRQIETQRADLNKIIRENLASVQNRFQMTIDRSQVALQPLFSLANVLRTLRAGVMELPILNLFSRLLRGGKTLEPIAQAFVQGKALEPIDELPTITAKLAPQLEGQDMKDIGDLVSYGQREVANMPASMQTKMIGAIQMPAKYERSFLTGMRQSLETIEQTIKSTELHRLEQAYRNTLLFLATWQVVMVLLLGLLVWRWDAVANTSDAPVEWVALGILLVLLVAGFVAVPIRGRWLHRGFANRLLGLQADYSDRISKASNQQVEYAIQLRREALSPLLRLVDAEKTTHNKQFTHLKNTEQTMMKIESDLNALGKRSILGIKI